MARDSSHVYAFFDVDETIWNEKSILSFYQYFIFENHQASATELWDKFNQNLQKIIASGLTREQLNAWFYSNYFKDLSISELQEACTKWCQIKFDEPGFWQEKVIDRINFHRNSGHQIVLISGSFRELLTPLQQRVNAVDILCAPLEEENNYYTGRMASSPMIGYGKTNAVVNYIQAKGADPENCYAYGDDVTDVPFLGAVGNPCLVINSNSKLNEVADAIGYKKLIL